jgi:hypothetical protein
VRAPDARTISVFTAPSVAPPTVTKLLAAAAARLPGTIVHEADFASHVSSSGDKNSYIFGTRGWLPLAGPLARGYFVSGGRISRGGTLNALASFHMVRRVIERPASMRW